MRKGNDYTVYDNDTLTPLKNLIPLCSKGLCDAEIITPASNPHFLTR